MKDIYPKNKVYFKKLIPFAKKIFGFCKEVGVNPVIYGSFMVFYYTEDENLEVNDIDFYVREKDYSKLIEIFSFHKLDFNYVPKMHTLILKNGELKIEFDSIDFWYKGEKELGEIDFYGQKMDALSLASLKKIYRRASESSNHPEGYKLKLSKLEKLG